MRKDEAEAIRKALARHTARLLCNLEAAECPVIFHTAVRSELDWLRKDIKTIIGWEEDRPNEP
jgi:hypothetical protein